MTRRGDELGKHILWVAKDVFLEMGYERASMDVVANRAETSKRSLYAHFENKEKLFLAVIELVRSLFLGRLGAPGDYSTRTSEALTLFCARFQEILLYEKSVQMMRVSMAESQRFPEQAAQYFDVLFVQVHARLSEYFKTAFELSTRSSAEAAQRLLAQILYPSFPRALFGLDRLAQNFGREALSPTFDLKPVRKIVAEVVDSLQKR